MCFYFISACYVLTGDPSSSLSAASESASAASYWDAPYLQPYFDNTTQRELTATVGQSALLHCRVRNLGDRAVSQLIIYLTFFINLKARLKARTERHICTKGTATSQWSLREYFYPTSNNVLISEQKNLERAVDLSKVYLQSIFLARVQKLVAHKFPFSFNGSLVHYLTCFYRCFYRSLLSIPRIHPLHT